MNRQIKILIGGVRDEFTVTMKVDHQYFPIGNHFEMLNEAEHVAKQLEIAMANVGCNASIIDLTKPKETKYFTFGQTHRHVIDGEVFDRNVVLEITSVDPRGDMFRQFGNTWSMQYDKRPAMNLFPGGIKKLDERRLSL